MMWIPVWAAGVVNGIGHYWGYRNFETPDASRNLLPVGILIGGEELHNNHHAFASAACFSQKPWELDIGWAYIRLLAGLRLARVKKLAPRPRVAEGGEKIDKEALTAIVVNRMHVMADYAQRVLWPVLRQTQRPVKQGVLPFRQARKLLVRDPKVMDAGAHGRLEAILARCQDLRTVYQYRQRLQAVWDRKACSHEALLAALQEWCAQAEATGIQVLEDFALRLRGYRMAVI